MMTTCTSLRSFVLSLLLCVLFTLASQFSHVVDAVIVSLDKDREECITRKIDVGVDADARGRQVMDFHVALHPKNVDSVEQDLTICGLALMSGSWVLVLTGIDKELTTIGS